MLSTELAQPLGVAGTEQTGPQQALVQEMGAYLSLSALPLGLCA